MASKEDASVASLLTNNQEDIEATGTSVSENKPEATGKIAVSVTRKAAKRSTLVYKLSATQRAKDFAGEGMYADGNIMFCKFCTKSVDWKRKNTVDDHVKSFGHQHRKKLANNTKREGDAQTVCGKKLQTIENVLTAKESRDLFISFNAWEYK